MFYVLRTKYIQKCHVTIVGEKCKQYTCKQYTCKQYTCKQYTCKQYTCLDLFKKMFVKQSLVKAQLEISEEEGYDLIRFNKNVISINPYLFQSGMFKSNWFSKKL